MSDKLIVRSSCRMCHGVCQVLVHLEGDRVVRVAGDPDSPASKGYICPKGAASPELLYHPDRLIYPLRRKGERGGNNWERISWDDALGEITERLKVIKKLRKQRLERKVFLSGCLGKRKKTRKNMKY